MLNSRIPLAIANWSDAVSLNLSSLSDGNLPFENGSKIPAASSFAIS